jgi:hypothetical protein
VDYERLQETPAARGGGITNLNAAGAGGNVGGGGGEN